MHVIKISLILILLLAGCAYGQFTIGPTLGGTNSYNITADYTFLDCSNGDIDGGGSNYHTFMYQGGYLDSMGVYVVSSGDSIKPLIYRYDGTGDTTLFYSPDDWCVASATPEIVHIDVSADSIYFDPGYYYVVGAVGTGNTPQVRGTMSINSYMYDNTDSANTPFSRSSYGHARLGIRAYGTYTELGYGMAGGTVTQQVDNFLRGFEVGESSPSADSAQVDSIRIYIGAINDTMSFLFGLYEVDTSGLVDDQEPTTRVCYQTSAEVFTASTSTGWYTTTQSFTGYMKASQRYAVCYLPSRNTSPSSPDFDTIFVTYDTRSNFEVWSTGSYTYTSFSSGLPSDVTGYTWVDNQDRAIGAVVYYSTASGEAATMGQIIIWQ